MSDSSKSKVQVSGGMGCFGCLAFVLVLWALLFGVTVGGVHYGMYLSCDQGLTFERASR